MGPSDELMTINTKIGWVTFGVDTKLHEASEHFRMNHCEEKAMNNMIRSNFTTEEFRVKLVATVKSSGMERAEKIIANTLVKSERCYEKIGLLPSCLTASSEPGKQLKKNPNMQTWLRETFKEYDKKG